MDSQLRGRLASAAGWIASDLSVSLQAYRLESGDSGTRIVVTGPGRPAGELSLRDAEGEGVEMRRAARQAIGRIRWRRTGAEPRQLSLAGGEAGALSLADGEAGSLSLADEGAR